MQVELRIRGLAGRVARAAFDGYDIAVDGSNTVVTGSARDEVEALAVIDRARSMGLVVVSWRLVDPSTHEEGAPAEPAH